MKGRSIVKFYVGAYASSPNVSGWDAEKEGEYYSQLKSLDSIKGLEHPFVGNLHGNDDAWFLENIDPNWDFVFTCIPGVMGALSKNPNFGLASDDEEGRQQAIEFCAQARDAIAKLNQSTGRQSVKGIFLQTAPNRTKASGSAQALEKSLNTLLEWDWQGAQLLIEHCDAPNEGHAPAKGFLSLEDEIKVLKALNEQTKTPLGIVINWGRSALETQRAEQALEHIETVKKADLLEGIMFSGASNQESEYGVWKDTHMPPAPIEPTSLMTEQVIHDCLSASGFAKDSDAIVGIKLGIRPSSTDTDTRVGINREALSMLTRYFDN